MPWYAPAAAAAVILLFLKPFRPLLKCLMRLGFAFCAVGVFNHVAAPMGFSLGLNLLNASLIGFLGVPGTLSALCLGILF